MIIIHLSASLLSLEWLNSMLQSDIVIRQNHQPLLI